MMCNLKIKRKNKCITMSLRATDPVCERGYRWNEQFLKILPGPPFTKEGVEIFPLWKRGIEGDFPLCELTLFIKRNKATKQSQEKISNVATPQRIHPHPNPLPSREREIMEGVC